MACKHCGGLITSLRGWVDKACDACLAKVDEAIKEILPRRSEQQ